MTRPGSLPHAHPAAVRLCAVLTSHNRRETTLRALAALQASAAGAPVKLSACLVDDGSSDGTAEAVRAHFPWVRVEVHRGPPLFWCRGMQRALSLALAEGHQHYLLLNDDTFLAPDALARLLACEAELRAAAPAPLIVVGSTLDPDTGQRSYGGERQPSTWRRTTFRSVMPRAVPQRLDTFNANVVLLPADAIARVGALDEAFEHSMGDIDYGLRARAAQVPVWLAPGYQGSCRRNASLGGIQDPSLPLRQRWELMLSRKVLPWRSWLHFTRRHGGALWPLYFAWPYAKLWALGIWQRRPVHRA